MNITWLGGVWLRPGAPKDQPGMGQVCKNSKNSGIKGSNKSQSSCKNCGTKDKETESFLTQSTRERDKSGGPKIVLD